MLAAFSLDLIGDGRAVVWFSGMFIFPVSAGGLDSIIGDEVILSPANKCCVDAKDGECWSPMSVEDNFIPWVVRAILYVLTCCGLLLNCAWAYKIHGMVRHFRQKVLKLRDEGEVSDSDDSSSEKHN